LILCGITQATIAFFGLRQVHSNLLDELRSGTESVMTVFSNCCG
jgi:hypothetical protein